MIDNKLLNRLRAVSSIWIRYHGLGHRVELDEVVNSAVVILLEGKVSCDGNLMYAVQKGVREWVLTPESREIPEQLAEDNRRQKIEIDDQLSLLPRKQRSLVELYLSGNSINSIAKSCNIGYYTASSMIGKGLDTIRRDYD